VRSKYDINPRRLLDNGVSIFLRQATTDCDLKAGVYFLVLPQLAEVSIKFVVGIFTNGTGIENHNICQTVFNRNVASALEQAR
jgi:hypothetical protein